MRSYKVRDQTGSTFDVEESKLHEAERDGYLPVVSNGKEEHRVASNDLPSAMKDGFKPVSSSNVGMTESGIRGIAQGASLGFADEITGGIESLFSDKTYEQARDESRANYAEAKEANPKTYLAGEIGGGVGSAFVPGLNIAKGAGLAKTALQSAALGGAMGAGYSEAEDLAGIGKDAAASAIIGGGLGGVAHAASPLLQKGIEKAGRGTRDLAERFMGRALGAERGTIKSLGMDKVKRAGGQFLDEGNVGAFSSTDDLIAKNQGMKQAGGEMMGQAYDAIDEAGASTFNPLNVATEVESQLAPTYRTNINKGQWGQLDNTIDSVLARGDGNIPLSEAQLLKEEIGAVAFPKGKRPIDPSPQQQMAMDAYRIVSEQIDNAIADGSAAIDKAGLADTLKKGKELYSNASAAGKLLENKQAREQGNNFLGLTDSIAGAGALGYGGTTGDWETAGGLMLGKKYLQKYGTQQAALGLNKLSKTLLKSPRMAEVYNKSPQAFNNLAQKLESQMGGVPQKAADNEYTASAKPYDSNTIMQKAQGTKYAQVLQNAAQRGDKALSASHFVLLSKDPEYRKAFLEDQNDDI